MAATGYDTVVAGVREGRNFEGEDILDAEEKVDRVGVGDGDIVGVGEPVGEAVGVVVGVREGEGVPVAEKVGVGVTEGVCEGV